MINKDKATLLRIAKEITEDGFTVDSYAAKYGMRWTDACELICRAESYVKDKAYTKAKLDEAIEAAVLKATLEEREACAKVCDGETETWRVKLNAEDEAHGAERCATAIRARGETK